MKYLFGFTLIICGQLAAADHFGQGSMTLMALTPGALGTDTEISVSSEKARVFTDATLKSVQFVVSDHPDQVNDGKTYSLEFEAPRSERLYLQAYDHVPAIGFTNPIYAAMDVPGSCNNPGGSFDVLEFDVVQVMPPAEDDELTQVTKLALNFIRTCNGIPTVAGAIRYNSSVPVTKPIAIRPATPREKPKYVAKIKIWGDAADYIGYGQSREFSSEDALLEAKIEKGVLQFTYDDGQSWLFYFAPKDGPKVGKFTSADRFLDYEDKDSNHMSVDSPGRGCNDLTGEFEIKELETTADPSEIKNLSLEFTQHCEGAPAALHGTISVRPR